MVGPRLVHAHEMGRGREQPRGLAFPAMALRPLRLENALVAGPCADQPVQRDDVRRCRLRQLLGDDVHRVLAFDIREQQVDAPESVRDQRHAHVAREHAQRVVRHDDRAGKVLRRFAQEGQGAERDRGTNQQRHAFARKDRRGAAAHVDALHRVGAERQVPAVLLGGAHRHDDRRIGGHGRRNIGPRAFFEQRHAAMIGFELEGHRRFYDRA
jgi:hypothetical protein